MRIQEATASLGRQQLVLSLSRHTATHEANCLQALESKRGVRESE